VLIIQIINGGFGNQVCQAMAATSIQRKSKKKLIGIFVDKKRKSANNLRAIYDKYYDVSNFPILRNIFTKLFWRESRSGTELNLKILKVFTGYFLDEKNFDIDNINEFLKCFQNLYEPISINRTCIHSRQGDFIALGRETLKDNELKINFPENAYLISDELDTNFNLNLQRKYRLTPYRSNSEIEDWLFMIHSKNIVCSPSTFSITAAVIAEALYNAETQRKLLSEV